VTRKTDYELGSDLVFGTALLACASFSATKHKIRQNLVILADFLTFATELFGVVTFKCSR